MTFQLIASLGRWLGGLLTYSTLAVLLYGIWRGTQRQAGRIAGQMGCYLRSRWFYVIELRKKLTPSQSNRHHVLAASVFDDDWHGKVSHLKPRPFLFIAEGFFPYFEETQRKSLFLKLRDHFPGAELVCDAHASLSLDAPIPAFG